MLVYSPNRNSFILISYITIENFLICGYYKLFKLKTINLILSRLDR